MGVSTRELMLVLRARDEASRVLRGLSGNITHMSKASQEAAQKHIAQGQSLITVGTGIAFAGAMGVKWLNDTTNAATDYNQQAAKTLTQTDDLGVSLETVKQIGMDLARTIPVPFEEIQGGLYDIFSSMDVTVPQAKNLLTEFSKAAVAGQVDLQTAGKGTIAILNAWHLPATKVNQVNDVMFQLVRKGVGTYKDFSNAIGRSIPSTVRAGGSIQDLAGMMAFMTRNGLSTAQAATSAGRAFDAMSNPKTEEHMKDIGLSVKNAKGEFKPMTQVIQELSEKMKDMTAPQRAKMLQELFKGSGGTIQARRFFDLAIPRYKQFNSLTDDMIHSSGAMGEAYDIMFQQPQSKIQLMTNKYNVMKVQIGDQLLPVKMKLIEAGMKVLDMWNNLSPGTQKFIAIAALVISVLTILVGILVVVVGGIMLLAGAAAMAGIALGPLILIILAVIVVIALLVAAGIWLYKNWGDISRGAKIVWTAIKNWVIGTMQALFTWLITKWLQYSQSFANTLANIYATTVRWWNNIVSFIRNIPNRISSGLSALRSLIGTVASNAWSRFREVVSDRTSALITYVRNIPSRIRSAFGNPGNILAAIGRSIIQGLINGVRSMIGSLQNQFSSITNMIPDWKGPAAVDKKLLYKAGQLTMEGYGDGVESRIAMIKSMMKQITNQIPSEFNTDRPVVSGRPVPMTAQQMPTGASQNFYITTQEIDPRKHAADLGYEVAKRLG